MNLISQANHIHHRLSYNFSRLSSLEKSILTILFFGLLIIDPYGVSQLCLFILCIYLIELFVTQR
jgi:hypothetical protein